MTPGVFLDKRSNLCPPANRVSMLLPVSESEGKKVGNKGCFLRRCLRKSLFLPSLPGNLITHEPEEFREFFSRSKMENLLALKRRNFWSGRPGSNRRRPAWEAGILPLNYARSERAMEVFYMELRRPCQSRVRPTWHRTTRNSNKCQSSASLGS
jgi:hypothetical protein